MKGVIQLHINKFTQEKIYLLISKHVCDTNATTSVKYIYTVLQTTKYHRRSIHRDQQFSKKSLTLCFFLFGMRTQYIY